MSATRDRSSSLLALTMLAFFMADVRDGLGPFLATYLQENHVRQDLIGYTMTAGGLAAVAMTPFADAWVDRSVANEDGRLVLLSKGTYRGDLVRMDMRLK